MSIYILKPMANLQENAAFFFCGETKQKKDLYVYKGWNL